MLSSGDLGSKHLMGRGMVQIYRIYRSRRAIAMD